MLNCIVAYGTVESYIYSPHQSIWCTLDLYLALVESEGSASEPQHHGTVLSVELEHDDIVEFV